MTEIIRGAASAPNSGVVGQESGYRQADAARASPGRPVTIVVARSRSDPFGGSLTSSNHMGLAASRHFSTDGRNPYLMTTHMWSVEADAIEIRPSARKELGTCFANCSSRTKTPLRSF